MYSYRPLHWVLKVGNLKKNVKFFEAMGMKVLRHEEFNEGCDAECNGDYDRPWSKTMMGYGQEDDHFALELTYNYGIKSYEAGNDLASLNFVLPESFVASLPFEFKLLSGDIFTESPDGYKIRFELGEANDPFQGVSINVENMTHSLPFWRDVMGMKVVSDDTVVKLQYDGFPHILELVPVYREIHHDLAYGRIAFAITEPIKEARNRIVAANGTIHKEPVTLETPGKANVDVVILKDPDGFEICFVNEDGFRDLSTLNEGDDHIDWEKRATLGADI